MTTMQGTQQRKEGSGNEVDVIDLTHVEEPLNFIVKKIFVLMAPTAIGSILAFSAQAITNSFVGRRLGSTLFAHYTLGISVANLFGFSVGIGLNGALDTFISQAFGRDKQATRDIGVSVQRALYLSTLCAIPLAAVLMWGGPIFRVLFGEELGNGALEFTRHAVPNLLLSFFTTILTKTLQAINLPELVIYSTAISAVSCLAINYWLTTSIATAVFTLSATFAIQLFVLVVIIRFHPQVTFWKHCEWPSRDAYSVPGVRQFLAVGIPSLLAVCAEWWAFEVLDIVAASISVHDVAAVNLVLTIGALYFSLALSIAVGSSVLVGNALGENRPALAKQFAYAGLVLGQIINAIDAAALIIFRHEIARAFTTDAALENTFCEMIIVIAIYICGDSTQYCLQSIFRSTGEQRTAAKVVMVSLWAIGIPMSIVLGKWLGMGAQGVVLGLVCGFCVEIPLMLYYLVRWPWDQLAKEASKRLDEELTAPAAVVESGVGPATLRNDSFLAKISEAASTVNLKQSHDRSGLRMLSEDDRDDDVHGSLVHSRAVTPKSRCTDNDQEATAAIIRQSLAAVQQGGLGGVHMTPPLSYHPRSHQPSRTVSPRNIDNDEDDDAGFGRVTRPVSVGAGGAARLGACGDSGTKTQNTPSTHSPVHQLLHPHHVASAGQGVNAHRPLIVMPPNSNSRENSKSPMPLHSQRSGPQHHKNGHPHYSPSEEVFEETNVVTATVAAVAIEVAADSIASHNVPNPAAVGSGTLFGGTVETMMMTETNFPTIGINK